MAMKGVILAAGKGTRMKDLTREMPKPLLEVAGRPVLEHILTGLRDAGVSEVCIIVGYRGDAIRSHFGVGSGLGMRLS